MCTRLVPKLAKGSLISHGQVASLIMAAQLQYSRIACNFGMLHLCRMCSMTFNALLLCRLSLSTSVLRDWSSTPQDARVSPSKPLLFSPNNTHLCLVHYRHQRVCWRHLRRQCNLCGPASSLANLCLSMQHGVFRKWHHRLYWYRLSVCPYSQSSHLLASIADTNACLTNPCDTNATCADQPAPSLSRTCTCKPGYSSPNPGVIPCTGVYLTFPCSDTLFHIAHLRRRL